MSTYVLMRILESAPRRYDLGMGLLTLGGVGRAYDRLAARVEEGQRVLDVGCGTGALALRMARRGACVKGIDVSAEMLELAAQRAREAGLAERVTLCEIGVAELDGEPAGSFDVVTSGLCLSELSDDEVAYTLQQARRVLVPGGLLLVADEVTPRGPVARVLRGLLRTPLVALTWLVTQQTSHALADLEERIASAGFEIVSRRRSGLGDFAEIVARAPAGASQARQAAP
jgi:demethylmenaquinone methyltransferase/2-methoxy-6-polyprenyl-1,4-benzoquinol methylase